MDAPEPERQRHHVSEMTTGLMRRRAVADPEKRFARRARLVRTGREREPHLDTCPIALEDVSLMSAADREEYLTNVAEELELMSPAQRARGLAALARVLR